MSCRRWDCEHLDNDLDRGPAQKHAPAPGGRDPLRTLVLLASLVGGLVAAGALLWSGA